MTAGQWQPPHRSAAVAPLGGEPLAAQAASAVHEELEDAGFTSLEALLPDVSGVGPLCDAFADSEDLLILVGGLTLDGSADVADALSQFTDAPLPGLQSLIFDAARRLGRSEVLFTDPWVGWIGTTLALSLPADEAVAASVMSELLPMYSRVLEQREAGSGGLSRGKGSADKKGKKNSGSASILRMPRPVTPDDEGDA